MAVSLLYFIDLHPCKDFLTFRPHVTLDLFLFFGRYTHMEKGPEFCFCTLILAGDQQVPFTKSASSEPLLEGETLRLSTPNTVFPTLCSLTSLAGSKRSSRYRLVPIGMDHPPLARDGTWPCMCVATTTPDQNALHSAPLCDITFAYCLLLGAIICCYYEARISISIYY